MKSPLLARWKGAGWNEFVFLASVLTLCLSVGAFFGVAAAVAHRGHQEMEEQIMLALRNPGNLAEPAGPWWLAELSRDLSALGSAVVVVSLALSVLGYFLLRRAWVQAVVLAVTIAGGYALSNGLKLIYARERPNVVPHLVEVSSASFPSGHSLASSMAYLTMGALLAQASARRLEKLYFIVLAFILIFLIGLSRVFLGAHYPTDVLAGWSAGIAWALICGLVAERWRTKQAGVGTVSPLR